MPHLSEASHAHLLTAPMLRTTRQPTEALFGGLVWERLPADARSPEPPLTVGLGERLGDFLADHPKPEPEPEPELPTPAEIAASINHALMQKADVARGRIPRPDWLPYPPRPSLRARLARALRRSS